MKTNNNGEYPDNMICNAYEYWGDRRNTIRPKPTYYTTDSVERAIEEIKRTSKRSKCCLDRSLLTIDLFYKQHMKLVDISKITNVSIETVRSDIRMFIKEFMGNPSVYAILENNQIPVVTRDTSILDTNLSNKTKFALYRGHRFRLDHNPTLGDILDLDFCDIKRTRNIGYKSIKELDDYVRSLGFELNKCSHNGYSCNNIQCQYYNMMYGDKNNRREE